MWQASAVRKLIGIAAAVAAIAIVIVMWLRVKPTRRYPPAPMPGHELPETPRVDPPATPDPPKPLVRKLTPAEHAELVKKINTARMLAWAKSGPKPQDVPFGSAGSAFSNEIKLEQVSSTVRKALDASIALLAECYPKDHPKGARAYAIMKLYSDPDVGTVIDTDEIKDETGKPLPAALDDCLRTTMEELELPPLEAGGYLPLQYNFVFD